LVVDNSICAVVGLTHAQAAHEACIQCLSLRLFQAERMPMLQHVLYG
jgi:hypothetical protein